MNRAIKNNALAWARDHGVAEDVVASLEKKAPIAAKEWLRQQGMNPDDFVDGVPATAGPAVGPGVGGGGGGGGGEGEGADLRAADAEQRVLEELRALLGPGGVAAPPRQQAGVAAGAIGGGGGGRRVARRPAADPPSPGQPGKEPHWTSERWCTSGLRNQIDAAVAAQGVHRDERSLLAGQPERARSVSEGTNETVKVRFANGVVGYHKPFEGLNNSLARGFGHDSAQQSLHEVAAWQLAREMGPPWSELVPPVVLREVNGRMGSVGLERPGRNMQMDATHVPEWREAAFFDVLIGQQDRHPGNFLVAGDRLSLIDHGYTFATPGDYCNYSWLARQREENSPALSHVEVQALDRLLGSADLLGMSRVLEPARAQALQARAEKMRASGRVSMGF